MAALFRGNYMAGLRALAPELRWRGGTTLRTLDPLYRKSWRVYLKPPFGGPEKVLAYLPNYTRRVGIANSRIQHIDEERDTVAFAWRDYADGGKVKRMELSGVEFVRRFCMHMLPRGFTRIRHYGILSNNRKSQAVPHVRLLLHFRATIALLQRLARPPESSLPACPRCGRGRMVPVCIHTPRGTIRLRPPPTPGDTP